MFIVCRRNGAVLRKEGHVNGEGKMIKIHMALLTEGDAARITFYKHDPPAEGGVQLSVCAGR